MAAPLCRKLTASRIEAGFRLPEDIAYVLGVSPRTIRNWESGKSRPKTGMLIAWAQVVGKPLEYFEDSKPATHDALQVITSPSEAPAPEPPQHPGLSALAADAVLLAENEVTPEELDTLRRWSCYDADGNPYLIETRSQALEVLRALRSLRLPGQGRETRP